MATSAGQEWVMLQRKLFSRWCHQKLVRRHDIPEVKDIITDIKDGVVLFAMIEELSGQKYADQKLIPKPGTVKSRIKQIEVLSSALKFTWAQGVDMKLKPSPEDLADGKEAAVLALIWALMMRFMKIGDDEDTERLNAKDALLMWVNNKCPELGHIESFKKTAKSPFHNGMALCSLIYKHRPKLLQEYEHLNPSEVLKNVERAQDAALKYFQLEKFLTPSDVTKLDENSMVVYVSEFYYGIAEQRKLDLAARRLTKLIKLTKENDRLKEEYKATAAQYKERLSRVEVVLNDRTIDNTMAGARKRLDDFYKYKTDDKSVLLGNQLSLEGLFNNLAMRLSHHKRPEFIPPEGVTLTDVQKALLHLEKVEQERSLALHAELNRQIKLVKLDGQHKTMYDNLTAWITEKEAYLRKKEIIESVSAAQFQLRILEAFDKESAAAVATNVAAMKKIGQELSANKYENQSAVEVRERDIDAKFELLGKLSAAKMPVLQDDLAREIYKQKTRLLFQEHTEKNDAIVKWIGLSRDYLNAREKVYSVTEAHTQISLLDSFEQEKVTMTNANVKEMKRLGEEIIARKHETQYSRWVFEHPEELRARFKHADDEWEALRLLSEEKRRVLEDHLTREELRERYRIANQQHIDMHKQLSDWINQKETYLQTFNKIESSSDCIIQLSLFSAYEQEKKTTRETQVVELITLGDEIRAAGHKSKYSSYQFDHTHTNEPVFDANDEPARTAVSEREQWVLDKFEHLTKLAVDYKKVLDDHKAREDFSTETRTLAQTFCYMFNKLSAWCALKHAFLQAREKIDSITLAQTHLTLLEQYVKENASVTNTTLASFNALGKKILAAKYETAYSTYEYEHTFYKLPSYDFNEPDKRQKLVSSMSEVEAHWKQLADEQRARKLVFEDHLARETFARKVRLMDEQHKKQFTKVEAWFETKKQYLSARAAINSVSDAQTQLSIFEAYEKEVVTATETSIAALKDLGEKIIPQVYKTEYSTFKCENPDEIKGRHESVVKFLATLKKLSVELKHDLDASLALEQEKERLRLEYAHLAMELMKYVRESGKDLTIESFGFTLEEVQEHKAFVESSTAALTAEADKRIAAIKDVKANMDKIGVKENIYTQLTLADVDKAKVDLLAHIAARDAAYKKELDRQIFNDNLCKQFAGLCDPFSKFIIEQKDKITGSKGDLEPQLDFVNAAIARIPQDGARLDPIKDLAGKMEAAGITNIRHTTLTLKDVIVQWEQFQKFLEAKKSMLMSEIEHAKLKGITPEQFKEIENNFKTFDKDGNGVIDRKELTACLYSLGEEKTSKEVSDIMAEFGDKAKGGISYEGFKNFMIRILGDSDTKAEIMDSLGLINKHDKLANHAAMEIVVAVADLEYFEATAPRKGNDWDYHDWVESMFAR